MIYLDKRESAVPADSFLFYRNKSDKGVGIPKLDKELILTQNPDILELYRKKGYEVEYLSSYIGIKSGLGLYEVFSFFFEGKVTDDFDMLEVLFNGLLVDSEWCFCVKIGVSFCWFKLRDKHLIKLGTMQFSEPLSKYAVGRFIKRLRYSIVKSGVNLSKIKFLTWNEEDLGFEFTNYIFQYDCLEAFFSNIDGLKNCNIETVMRLLSKNTLMKYTVNAENFVDCLNEGFYALGLEEQDGILYSRNTYYKDYSSCVSSIIDWSRCSYGIIIDCEGQMGQDGSLNKGCRELGGIIFCRYQNILLSIDTFSCDNLLLEATLLQVIKNYRGFSSSSLRSIDVLTFGTSDSIMLNASITELCSRKTAKQITSQFRYVDCRDFIMTYIREHNMKIEGRSTLANIARQLEVLPIFPKHKPINDARTLFNILAKILYETGEFLT